MGVDFHLINRKKKLILDLGSASWYLIFHESLSVLQDRDLLRIFIAEDLWGYDSETISSKDADTLKLCVDAISDFVSDTPVEDLLLTCDYRYDLMCAKAKFLNWKHVWLFEYFKENAFSQGFRLRFSLDEFANDSGLWLLRLLEKDKPDGHNIKEVDLALGEINKSILAWW
jgi:hypothetical protein